MEFNKDLILMVYNVSLARSKLVVAANVEETESMTLTANTEQMVQTNEVASIKILETLSTLRPRTAHGPF